MEKLSDILKDALKDTDDKEQNKICSYIINAFIIGYKEGKKENDK